MKWNEQKLKQLGEVNKERKIPRYFAIKKMIEDEIRERDGQWQIAIGYNCEPEVYQHIKDALDVL